MPSLSQDEIERLALMIHAARSDAQEAVDERADDAAVDAALIEVARAKKALDDAITREAEASRKYSERVALATEREALLRAQIEAGWPGSVKSIGCATMQTRRSVDLAKGLPAADAFRRLDAVLGATGALPKVVVGLKLDSKAALVFADSMPALHDVLVIEEKRSLTIRQPEED